MGVKLNIQNQNETKVLKLRNETQQHMSWGSNRTHTHTHTHTHTLYTHSNETETTGVLSSCWPVADSLQTKLWQDLFHHCGEKVLSLSSNYYFCHLHVYTECFPLTGFLWVCLKINNLHLYSCQIKCHCQIIITFCDASLFPRGFSLTPHSLAAPSLQNFTLQLHCRLGCKNN